MQDELNQVMGLIKKPWPEIKEDIIHYVSRYRQKWQEEKDKDTELSNSLIKKQLAEINKKENKKSANMQAVIIQHIPNPEGSYTPESPKMWLSGTLILFLVLPYLFNNSHGFRCQRPPVPIYLWWKKMEAQPKVLGTIVQVVQFRVEWTQIEGLVNLYQSLEGKYLKVKHKAILPAHLKQVSSPNITVPIGKDKVDDQAQDLLEVPSNL